MGCRGLPGCSIIRASLPVALMVSLPRFGSLWAFGPSAHRAHASLRACRGLGQRPKPCAAAQKSERCECPKGTRNAPRSTPPRISAQTARPSSTRRGRAASIQKTLSLERPAFLASLRSLATRDGLCRRKRRRPPLLPASSRVSCSLRSLAALNGLCGRKRWRPPASSCIMSRFLLPSVARSARRALPPEALASSCVFLHQAAFLASLRSLATLTAFAAAEVFGALPQTPARA